MTVQTSTTSLRANSSKASSRLSGGQTISVWKGGLSKYGTSSCGEQLSTNTLLTARMKIPHGGISQLLKYLCNLTQPHAGAQTKGYAPAIAGIWGREGGG